MRLPNGVRHDPLLRFGACLMAFALLFGGVVAVYAYMSGPYDRTAVKSATEPRGEALVRSDPGVDPWKEPTVAPAEAEEPDPVPEPKPDTQSEPEPGTNSRPSPEPRLEPEPLPVRQAEWPAPTEEQVEETREPRRYDLPSGAPLGLTVGAIGLYDVPVLRSDVPGALDQGVVHARGTSMPWSRTPERNVYLAGHRLGWPGTGSHLVFYRLDELGEGDEVELRDREGKRYGYRVVDTFVVGPEESWVMGRIRGRDLLTLQTCVGPDFSKRLIVRAERV